MTPINAFMCPSDPGPIQSTIRVSTRRRADSNSGPKLSYFGNFGDNHNDDNTVGRSRTCPSNGKTASAKDQTQTGIMCRSGGTVNP